MWKNRVWKSFNGAMSSNHEIFISTFVQIGIARSKGHSLLEVRFLKIEFRVETSFTTNNYDSILYNLNIL